MIPLNVPRLRGGAGHVISEYRKMKKSIVDVAASMVQF
jgi:hypothetical protein